MYLCQRVSSRNLLDIEKSDRNADEEATSLPFVNHQSSGVKRWSQVGIGEPIPWLRCRASTTSLGPAQNIRVFEVIYNQWCKFNTGDERTISEKL